MAVVSDAASIFGFEYSSKRGWSFFSSALFCCTNDSSSLVSSVLSVVHYSVSVDSEHMQTEVCDVMRVMM